MSKRILIVDDVKMNRRLIKSILSKSINDAEYYEAEDGFKAMEIIAKYNITVVILDIMMPGKTGIEVLEEIKKSTLTRHIPVIMCSAIHESASVEKALDLGALDYFTKPLSEEDIRINLPLKVRNALEYCEDKKTLIKFYNHVKDEMQLAEQLQKALVSEHEKFETGQMWGRYLPCEEIGGDIYCVKEVGDKLWFIIADVSGHGISSAMISTMLSVIFNMSVEVCNEPDEMLTKINKVLYKTFNGTKYGLVSAFAGYMRDNEIYYANAGHPYPVLYRHNTESVETLEARGFLLGMFENREFTSACKDIFRDDAIFLYTDGLFDKGVDKGFAKWGIVKDYCEDHKKILHTDENFFVDHITQRFTEYEGKDFVDDVAFMLIKKR